MTKGKRQRRHRRIITTSRTNYRKPPNSDHHLHHLPKRIQADVVYFATQLQKFLTGPTKPPPLPPPSIVAVAKNYIRAQSIILVDGDGKTQETQLQHLEHDDVKPSQPIEGGSTTTTEGMLVSCASTTNASTQTQKSENDALGKVCRKCKRPSTRRSSRSKHRLHHPRPLSSSRPLEMKHRVDMAIPMRYQQHVDGNQRMPAQPTPVNKGGNPKVSCFNFGTCGKRIGSLFTWLGMFTNMANLDDLYTKYKELCNKFNAYKTNNNGSNNKDALYYDNQIMSIQCDDELSDNNNKRRQQSTNNRAAAARSSRRCNNINETITSTTNTTSTSVLMRNNNNKDNFGLLQH